MSDCDHACQFDAMEVAYAVVHLQHINAPLEERLDCGYCSRDYYKNPEWDALWDKRRALKSEGAAPK